MFIPNTMISYFPFSDKRQDYTTENATVLINDSELFVGQHLNINITITCDAKFFTEKCDKFHGTALMFFLKFTYVLLVKVDETLQIMFLVNPEEILNVLIDLYYYAPF